MNNFLLIFKSEILEYSTLKVLSKNHKYDVLWNQKISCLYFYSTLSDCFKGIKMFAETTKWLITTAVLCEELNSFIHMWVQTMEENQLLKYFKLTFYFD